MLKMNLTEDTVEKKNMYHSWKEEDDYINGICGYDEYYNEYYSWEQQYNQRYAEREKKFQQEFEELTKHFQPSKCPSFRPENYNLNDTVASQPMHRNKDNLITVVTTRDEIFIDMFRNWKEEDDYINGVCGFDECLRDKYEAFYQLLVEYDELIDESKREDLYNNVICFM